MNLLLTNEMSLNLAMPGCHQKMPFSFLSSSSVQINFCHLSTLFLPAFTYFAILPVLFTSILLLLLRPWLCTLKEKTVNSQRRPGQLAKCNKIFIAQFVSSNLAIKAYCRRPFAIFLRCAYLLVYLDFSMLLPACSLMPINNSGIYADLAS